MRAAGPLPVAVPATAEEYLAGRRILLAAADALDDVVIRGAGLRITPLKATTLEKAKDAAGRLKNASQPKKFPPILFT